MHARRWRLLFILVTAASALALGIGAAADVGSGSGPPTSVGHGGAAASVERIATQAAIDTLRRGGNAVDAAVAAAGVLGVTEPFSCGVGGGGFMVIRTADGKVTTIDGRETAPAAMTPTSFWENGAPLPFSDARFSGMSVGVPGTVAMWVDVLDAYGTWKYRAAPFDPKSKEELKDDHRVIWVIVNDDDEATHLRLSGPKETVDKYYPGFEKFLKGLK